MCMPRAKICSHKRKLKGFQNPIGEVQETAQAGNLGPAGLVAFWVHVWRLPLLIKIGKVVRNCGENAVRCIAKIGMQNVAFLGK